jgi:hypothetical protein
MTDHDDQRRPIEPDPIAPDPIEHVELTLEADPVWLDQIRASTGDPVDALDASDDPELTIDASPELADIIRREIARRDATAGDPTAGDAPTVPPPHAPPVVPPSPVAGVPSVPAPPPARNGRWQPQERLANRAPVTASAPIVRTDHRHRTKDSTKIVLAAIAATAVVAIVWLLAGGDTADAPPVIDPASTVDATEPATGGTGAVSTGPVSSSPVSTPP